MTTPKTAETEAYEAALLAEYNRVKDYPLALAAFRRSNPSAYHLWPSPTLEECVKARDRATGEISAPKFKSNGDPFVVARLRERLSGLTPEQQAAVFSIAGEDAKQQLATIDGVAPSWAAAAEGDSK